jgi:cell division protein FtsZ
MAVGESSGEDRAIKAAEQAMSSDLLDITIDGARGILFNVTGGTDLALFEVNEAAAIIKETAHPDVNLIFGAVIDPAMEERFRITVIATGFEKTGMPTNIMTRTRRPSQVEGKGGNGDIEELEGEFVPRSFNTENLDIPTFLRNRSRSR